ncbi:MAG: alpha/beta hydrolase [Nibricoccus sp.]
MKSLLFYFCLVVLVDGLFAAEATWQPSPGFQEISLWPGAVPHPQPDTGPEVLMVSKEKFYVAGRSVAMLASVSKPTMTVYPAKGRNTGAAVVVFPGGGYEDLAMDLEGTEVCDWLTAKGVTCVLLKYRVPGPGFYPKPAPYRKSGPYPRSPVALADAQRAIKLVRAHAAEWKIDPQKIGVLGFSAGGHLVAATSTQFNNPLYPAVDDTDKESCRPDFAVALYPGHLWNYNHVEHPPFKLNPAIPVTRETPPTFILQAEDDPVDDVNNSLVYYIALKEVEVPVEMHLYAQGGHAFGLRRTKLPITGWPDLVDKWLVTIGMMPE